MTFRPDSALVAAVVPSANHEPRRLGAPDMLLLHYTGVATAAQAIDWLARPESKVSCHYVVDEAGAITQMVPEGLRAWHAGVASWQGETDVNSCSIGIEIHNAGHADGYPEFPDAQISSVIALCRDIVTRNAIQPARVLAHSDVAPLRKIDPGEKFPWRRLAEAGIGIWVAAPADVADLGYGPGSGGPAVAKAQRHLAAIGYGVTLTGEMDGRTVAALAAVQRRFRVARIDGRLDRGTRRLLPDIVEAFSDPPRRET